jgi:DNA-binding transcriptional regulator PaaX
MKEPEIIPKILEILQAGAETTVQILDIFTSGYGESYRKLHAYRRKPLRFRSDWAEIYRERQKLYSLLNKLKREGFVKKNDPSRRSGWVITKAGLAKLEKIKKTKDEQEKLNDGLWRIATFDIPEKERSKREWLRSNLRNNGFKMLHESVWIGKRKLPEKFFLAMDQKKLIGCIHIFEISKTGTLRELT